MHRYLKKLRRHTQPPEVNEKLDISRHSPDDEERSYYKKLCKYIPMESGIVQSVIQRIRKYKSKL
jgi:hypothetical protein